MLWAAFAALALFIAAGVGLTFTVLQMEKRYEFRILEESRPLLDAVGQMARDLELMVSTARAYVATQQTQFTVNYEEAAARFNENASLATQLATDPQDRALINDMKRHFVEVKAFTDRQLELAREGKGANAIEVMLEAARIRSTAPDHAGMIITRHRTQASQHRRAMDSFRQSVTLIMVSMALAILVGAWVLVGRIEKALGAAITREIRRTEAMIAGMADGVMLIDAEGRSVFINPAGQKLLGTAETDVPIFRHSDVYGLRDAHGRPIAEKDMPAAQALATGRPVQDATMLVVRGGRDVAISVSATPLHEDGHITGAIVNFRDITERRRFEAEIQIQAERAQILADAGAFFSSTIDPVWVTQAIAERVAEVLGDWAAVILKVPDSKELQVASIYHRDMTSLGMAWSYVYRQPLVIGEGLIGQVIATGYPSMTTNVPSGMSPQEDTTSYHAPSMQLASLLILPLRTRRETLGALVIAANDPDRVMTDDQLPLAEVLAERAALAVENAKLYTEQVEARRKVEDLSRLKDEFLSIASHELRTPVTSIKGYTQLAKTLIRENDLGTSEEYLDIALDQIDRMSRLILELLDVSRIETGRLEIRRDPILWPNFVRDVVHRHHTAVSDRRFHVNVPDEKKIVNGDRDRLEQVLGNLLENAVKYSPDGSEIFVNVEDKGENIVTSVSDRGIGIPPDELQQVFERFHRGRQVSSTNYGGLGLGLYITKQIIERHAGSIWVESREGHGTTFYFTLPEAQVPAPAPTQDMVRA
jgi:PAS domain S-box-containing protein